MVKSSEYKMKELKLLDFGTFFAKNALANLSRTVFYIHKKYSHQNLSKCLQSLQIKDAVPCAKSDFSHY